FDLEGGNRIYVTNKFSILAGPREWLEPVGLTGLRREMAASSSADTDTLYVSDDPPALFDSKYPNHVLGVQIQYSARPGRLAIVVSRERVGVSEDPDEHIGQVEQLLAGAMKRHRGSQLKVSVDPDMWDHMQVSFEIPIRGKSVGDALLVGSEIEAILEAGDGGSLTLITTVDLIRSGYAASLVSLEEGPWFDAKSAPYQLDSEAQKWELTKDVVSFANSESGGVILIGATTVKDPNGEIVKSVRGFQSSMVNPDRYKKLLIARSHPRIEGLEIRLASVADDREVAFIYVPPQREELKPFVIDGIVTAGGTRTTFVSIPVRDGENTRYAGTAEIRSLLQAGRVALKG
ncbi:MAG: AlbA family DNA-binding domain-containing protein, partial [Thermomicrobiales bacterium]